MLARARSAYSRVAGPNHMSDDAFADLEEALEEALAFDRCERRDLNVTRIRAASP
jgi:hypothetical protein